MRKVVFVLAAGSALDIVRVIVSNREFISETLRHNLGALRGEYPQANIEELLKLDIPNVRVEHLEEPWLRVGVGLVYANAVRVLMSMFSKGGYDRRVLAISAFYSWQKSIEFIVPTESKAIIALGLLGAELASKFGGELSTPYLVGGIEKALMIDAARGVNLAFFVIHGLLEHKLADEALILVDSLIKFAGGSSFLRRSIPELLRLKGKILMSVSRLEDAERVFERAYELDGVNTIEHAEAKFRLGKYNSAVEIIMGIKDWDAESLRIAVDILYKAKRFREALDIIDNFNLEEVDEDSRRDILLDKALILIETGEYQRSVHIAKSLLLKSLKPPQMARAYHIIGLAQALLGENSKAIDNLEKALAIAEGGNVDVSEKILILARLVAININVENTEKAREYLEKAKLILSKEGKPQLESIIKMLELALEQAEAISKQTKN